MSNDFNQPCCSVCGQSITLADRGVTCPVCGNQQHTSCIRGLGHCATPNCTGLTNSPFVQSPGYRAPANSSSTIIPPTPPSQPWNPNTSGIPIDAQAYAPVAFDLSAILNHAWKTFGANMGMAIAGTLLYIVTVIVGQNIPIFSIFFAILYVPLLEGGLAAYNLEIVNGKAPNLGTIFNQFPAFGRWMGSYWLRGLIALGLMLLPLIIIGSFLISTYGMAMFENFDKTIAINPGPFILSVLGGTTVSVIIIAAVMMRWFFVPYLVAEGARTIEAFQHSSEITRGIRWRLFWYAFIIGLINLAGVLACVVGLLFTLPLTYCAMAAMFNAAKTLYDQRRSPQAYPTMR